MLVKQRLLCNWWFDSIYAHNYYKLKITVELINRQMEKPNIEDYQYSNGDMRDLTEYTEKLEEFVEHVVVQQKELLLDFSKYMNTFSPSPNITKKEVEQYLKYKI